MPGDLPEDPHPHTGIDERAAELDRTMDAEPEDVAWARTTVAALRGFAPDANEVTCRTRTCRIVVVCATEKEIFAIADKLRPHADRVIATAPEDDGGKLRARLYVEYER